MRLSNEITAYNTFSWKRQEEKMNIEGKNKETKREWASEGVRETEID